MRKIVIEVPDDCRKCEIGELRGIHTHFISCKFRPIVWVKVGNRKIKPVKACRDAEVSK